MLKGLLRSQTIHAAFDIATTFTMLVAAGIVIWSAARTARPVRPQAPHVPSSPVAYGGAPVLGAASARIVILEFADFQCPYCAKFVRETFPVLKRRYIDTGAVQFAFLHLPLRMHPRAQRAAEGAMCAAQQSRFWEMHDTLFANPEHLADDDLLADARALRLDGDVFAACMDGHWAAAEVKMNIDTATGAGVTQTPFFLFGTSKPGTLAVVREVLAGAAAVDEFAARVQRLMQAEGAVK